MDIDIVRKAISSLFTMTIVFDRDLRIVECSDRLQMRCPSIAKGADLSETFDFHRPRRILNFQDIADSEGSLFLMVSHDGKFALRGQVICPQGGSGDWGIFLGSPWMLWMTENRPDVTLEMADFPKHDAQLDHEFYITSQKAVVHDLEIVNKELRKARDMARKAEKTRSSFFAVMSHEMRTPLNGVISSLSLINDSQDEGIRNKLLHVAQTSASNLLSVINYVLDYSKLEAGKMELEETAFDMKECVGSVVNILAAKVASKGIDLHFQIAADCPRFVVGDDSKLRQVLINLTSNSVKFTDKGWVNIRVSCDSQHEGKANINFVVEDTGSGIDEADQTHIFQPFWSASNKSSSGDDNTGLGLNICSSLIKLMHGEIAFTSELGKGSSFTVTLPFAIAEGQDVSERVAKSEGNILSKKYRGNILLVDDNQTNLMVGQMMLENLGLHVRTASDGEEAIEIVSQVNFDLILMDITMPQMNGMEATRHLRAQGFQLPIIALTAHVGVEARKEYLDCGMQHVLYKPIDSSALVKVISEYLPEITIEEFEESSQPAEAGTVTATLNSDMFDTLVSAIGKDNIRRAFELFEQESSSRIKKILYAWVQRDLISLADEAHTLKSSAASFGADEMSDLMKSIELASRNTQTEQLVQMIMKVEKVYQSSIQLLQQKLGGLNL